MIRRCFLIGLAVAFWTDQAGAESEPLSIEVCQRAQSGVFYKTCLGELLELEEERLTYALAAAREKISREEVARRFDAAQNKWAGFVSQECALAFAKVAPGSGASAAETRCRILLARDRIRYLAEDY